MLIRGLPNFVTTLNDRQIFTTTGRGIALADIPADLVKQIEVFKTQSADQFAGGLVGAINVDLRRPFDFEGFELAGTARGLYSENTEDTDPIGRVLVSNRWNTDAGEFGAMLDELIGRRHKAVLARSCLRQSFATATCKPRALARTLRALEALISELDQRMQALIAQDQSLACTAQHLHTIVGFGPLLSTSMAHLITRHPFKNADAFVAYIGYDPRARDSGQLRGRRYLSKRGPAEMRRLLFTAAMSACKSKLWRPLYLRYRARGLSSTATLVILARKLARIAFSIARQGTDFQPERVQVACVQP